MKLKGLKWLKSTCICRFYFLHQWLQTVQNHFLLKFSNAAAGTFFSDSMVPFLALVAFSHFVPFICWWYIWYAAYAVYFYIWSRSIASYNFSSYFEKWCWFLEIQLDAVYFFFFIITFFLRTATIRKTSSKRCGINSTVDTITLFLGGLRQYCQLQARMICARCYLCSNIFRYMFLF